MNSKSVTILVIEDESTIRESISEFLEDRNYTVLTAENGRVGIEIFQKERPDLVLTDLRMPEVDGLEVLQKIRDISPNTPLIVISGTGDINDSILALKSGAWDYILKPVVDMSIIIIAIDKALERALLLLENQAYQENLEILVRERTEELEKANTHLTDINARLQKIVNTARKLSLCEDVTRFGTTLLSEFAQHMFASGGSLFLVESKGLRKLNTLEPGHVPDFIDFPLPEGSILMRTIELGKPLLINDIHTETNLISSGWNGYRDGSVLAFPLPDETGRIIGVLTLHSKARPPFVDQDREIGSILASYSCETLRAVQSSEAVRESEKRQSVMLDSLNIGIVVVDPVKHTIIDCNPKAAQLIGASKNDIINTKCHPFFCQAEKGKCPLTDLGLIIDNSEQHLVTVDGSKIPILKTIVPIQLKGQTCYLESFVDISRQKQIEQEKEKLEFQLVQAQKMEAIGTLAGGLAHDLNNALNGIYAPISLLLRKNSSDEQIPAGILSKQLNRIHDSGHRIADMVSQLMTVSQKQELSLTTVNLNDSIRHILKIAQNTFDKSIEIKPVLFEGQALVRADPTQIEQVFLNLFINASHAMTIMRDKGEKWGGRLEVAVSSIQVDRFFKNRYPNTKEGCYWAINVNDTGVGIEEKDLQQIFTPFFTKKEKGQGTGLGLAMVYNIISQHNGFINVHSKPNIGTSFEIFLPEWIRPSNEKSSIKKRKTLQKGEGLILIVDDEEVLRSSAEEILAECGYYTLVAENGVQAIEIYQKKYPEIKLVILDMVMPKMSGNETYKIMKEINPNVSVLLVSGFKQDDRVQAILDLGVTNFLQKPYDLYSLADAVKKCLP
ncbi:response regulator [bacterium]|nr:response regulator [bacterium]